MPVHTDIIKSLEDKRKKFNEDREKKGVGTFKGLAEVIRKKKMEASNAK